MGVYKMVGVCIFRSYSCVTRIQADIQVEDPQRRHLSATLIN